MHGSPMADNPTPANSDESAARKMPVGRPFQPGQSGNPSGRPKTAGPVRELAREHTEVAIRTLVEIAQNEEAQPSARVSAASALLDRGWGKPTQPLEHAGADGGALTVVIRREGETKP